VERSKKELEHRHKNRNLKIKENENRKRREVKMFDKAKYEAGLSKKTEGQKPPEKAGSVGK
jgi:hypothetical protein